MDVIRTLLHFRKQSVLQPAGVKGNREKKYIFMLTVGFFLFMYVDLGLFAHSLMV